jgi:hypothetical protein
LAKYTNLRWEAGVEGWELWATLETPGFYDSMMQVAWVYENHHRGTWMAHVYGMAAVGGRFTHEFGELEEAQAWCVVCAKVE